MTIARDFIKRGLLLAVGNKPDYEVIWKASEWFRLGILLEDDLAEIQEAIDAQEQEALTDEQQ
jgi:hypothetical protein